MYCPDFRCHQKSVSEISFEKTANSSPKESTNSNGRDQRDREGRGAADCDRMPYDTHGISDTIRKIDATGISSGNLSRRPGRARANRLEKQQALGRRMDLRPGHASH